MVALLLAVLVSACQVRVTTDVRVASDGGGDAVVTIVVDDELRDALAAAEVDLRAGLEEAAAGASWTATPVDRTDATGVELRTTFDEPAELGERIDALTAGLAVDDGALLRDVELTRTEDGGYRFEADAGIDPPRILGTLPLPAAETSVVEDPPVDDATGPDAAEPGAAEPDAGPPAPPPFDGDDLGELMAAAGDRFAVAELRVSMPTVPEAPGATVESTSATWSLPVDGLATVTATAPPVPIQTRTALAIAAGAGGLLLGLLLVRASRRRS